MVLGYEGKAKYFPKSAKSYIKRNDIVVFFHGATTATKPMIIYSVFTKSYSQLPKGVAPILSNSTFKAKQERKEPTLYPIENITVFIFLIQVVRGLS